MCKYLNSNKHNKINNIMLPKDQYLLEEIYKKSLLKEFEDLMPSDEEPSEEDHMAQLKQALESGDQEKAKMIIVNLAKKLSPEEEKETSEGEVSAGMPGRYTSKKDDAAQKKEDFLINRMKWKAGDSDIPTPGNN